MAQLEGERTKKKTPDIYPGQWIISHEKGKDDTKVEKMCSAPQQCREASVNEGSTHQATRTVYFLFSGDSSAIKIASVEEFTYCIQQQNESNSCRDHCIYPISTLIVHLRIHH